MKQSYKILLAITVITLLIACTPQEQQTAVLIQSDINSATPIAIEAAQTGLNLSGNPGAAAVVGAAAPVVESGQAVILQDLQKSALANPAPAAATTPAPGK